MAIFEVGKEALKEVSKTSFASANIREREDLQRLLKAQIEIIAPGCMVLSEEFGYWNDSRRRIDLLCIDKQANLVVVELKRTDDGGHMDLQSIRYAAMISTMTFDNAVSAHNEYLIANGIDSDPEEQILSFLEWEEKDDDNFAQDVRIVLASAEFSKEITSSVLWLNQRELDIRCVRMMPYRDGDRTLIDVQQVIPLPETEEYQIQIKEKLKEERSSRTSKKDLFKYEVQLGNLKLTSLPKRKTIFQVVKYLCDQGVTPDAIQALITFKKGLFYSLPGELDGDDFREKSHSIFVEKGLKANRIFTRFFSADEEIIYSEGYTYCLTKMWGKTTEKVLEILSNHYSEHGFTWKRQ